MSKQIWNEGRVVGYSAYELYVKRFLAENPDGTPATEQEWLASTIGLGSSLLLRVPLTPSNIPADQEYYHIDIPLPEGSKLVAANVIIGSFFYGGTRLYDDWGNHEDAKDLGPWANWVTNYGQLIPNSAAGSHPNGYVDHIDDTTVPVGDIDTYIENYNERLNNYLKIKDAVVIQPGTWTSTAGKVFNLIPSRDLEPDLSKQAVIRLCIKGRITDYRPHILLTGFTDKSILTAVSKLEGSVVTSSPENGDFLGPAVYPWANKVILTMPNSAAAPMDLEYIPNQRRNDSNQTKATVTVTDSPEGAYKVLSMMDPDTRELFDIRGTGNIIQATRGTIHWDDLLRILTSNESLDLLASALGAGDYISLTRGSDGKWIIKNEVPNSLTAGEGIQIDIQDNGKIKITNTMPYVPAGLTYKYLYHSSGQFTPVFFNDWTICTNRSMVKNGAVASNPGKFITNATSARKEIMLGYNGDSLVKKSNGKYTGWMHFRLLIGPSESMVNKFLTGSKKTLMLQNRANIYFGCRWVNPYQFMHSNITNTRFNLATMLGLRFNNLLAQLTSATTWQTTCTDDIWNVRALYYGNNAWHSVDTGGSWVGTIQLRGANISYNANGFPSIIAARYADGHNTQLTEWAHSSSNYGQSNRVIVTSINNRMSGSVHVADLDYDGLESLQQNTSKNYYATDMVAKNFNDN